MQGYDFRPVDADPAQLAECAALLGTALSPHFDRAFLHWQYAENPVGGAIGFNAFHNGALVAHYATLPLVASIDGRIEKGLLSLNTATYPAHQGKGLSSTLARHAYALGAESGYRFIIGVANANSTPMFIKKLGFQLVAPLDVRVGIGNFEPGEDSRNHSYSPHWTDEARAWRLKRPGARYVTGALHGSARDVFAKVSKLGILACLDRVPSAVTSALAPAPVMSPFRLRIGLDRSAKSRGVFVPLPDRLKPSPLNLIFLDLGGTARTLDRDHVRWTLLDFDAY